MNTRTCPICQEPIFGRTDKIYCGDQCRALANNKKKMESQYFLIVTNQILRKNRTILKTLCPQGKATVRKEVLISMGFNLNNFTSIFVTGPKQVYYMSYDYGYLPIMEGQTEKALIISRQDYMKDWDPWKFLKR
jgi:predicted nucleic acid-binding Zn ribbon protein